jgi:UDPglucose 6-dehydrogenase
MVQKIITACGGSVDGKTIAVLGVTFKPNTDDMRDAPGLVILPGLIEAGATIRAFDPAGMDEAKGVLEGIDWREDAYDTMEGAHALVILTEWNEFRALALDRVKALMAEPVMIDLRNVYDPPTMAVAGFRYVCVGRGTELNNV